MDLKRLNELAPKAKRRKRVGCGPGSGHGKTSCRGQDGQGSRSGGVKYNFGGGAMPLFRKVPKRGFSNFPHKVLFEEVKLESLIVFEPNTVVTRELLMEKKLIRRRLPVKILGNGEIDRALTIQANKFTKSAQDKIEKAGGKVEVIE